MKKLIKYYLMHLNSKCVWYKLWHLETIIHSHFLKNNYNKALENICKDRIYGAYCGLGARRVFYPESLRVIEGLVKLVPSYWSLECCSSGMESHKVHAQSLLRAKDVGKADELSDTYIPCWHIMIWHQKDIVISLSSGLKLEKNGVLAPMPQYIYIWKSMAP